MCICVGVKGRSPSSSGTPGQASGRDSVLFMAGSGDSPPLGPLRLAELLGSVSLATDLGTGQPLGHALRTCTIATALAEAMGCGSDDVRTIHQFALLRFVGCTSDAVDTAAMVGGDERAYNAAMAPVLMGSGREMLGRHVRSVAPGQPRMRRLRLVAERSPIRRAGSVRCPRIARSPPCWPDASVWSSRSSTPSPTRTSAGTGRGTPTDSKETPSPSQYASPSWRETPISQPPLHEDARGWMGERRGRAYDPAVVDAFDAGGT